jgi:hypothetical protein
MWMKVNDNKRHAGQWKRSKTRRIYIHQDPAKIQGTRWRYEGGENIVKRGVRGGEDLRQDASTKDTMQA